jgi:phosphate transport system permease protein
VAEVLALRTGPPPALRSPREDLLSTFHTRIARAEETVVRVFLAACAALSVAITVGIVAVLALETIAFFRDVPLASFLTGTRWEPLFEPRRFGIWPLVAGTLWVTLGAALVGMPAGLGIAVFLNEYSPRRVALCVKPAMELLAGVPTVVYGYFAVTTITPWLKAVLPSVEVFNAASASIVVGVMILPMIASLCDDALRAVPRTIKDAGYALGATKFEVTAQVTVPAALSGVVAAFILALSRAIGETMAVTLAAGSTPKLTLDPFESVQTLTAYIVQVSLGDTPDGTVEYRSIFAVGTVLFLVTLGFNMFAHRLVRRFRSVYE